MKKYFMRKIVLFLTVFFSILSAQYLEDSKYSGVGLPYFEAAVYRQFAFDKKNTRVTAVCEFLYDDFTFDKSDSGGYHAKIKLITAIYNDKDRMVNSHIDEKEIFLKRYERTNSRNDKILIHNNFLLAPGKYFIVFKAIDMVTKKDLQRKSEINIPDYSKEDLSISDIRLYRDVTVDSLGRVISFVPAYGSNFTDRNSLFFAIFDVYSKMDTVAAVIRISMINMDKGAEIDTTIKRILVNHLTIQLVEIPIKRLKHNAYTLKVRVKIKGASAEKEHKVSFYWTEVPGTEEDIDLAFDQMGYISEADSQDYFRDKSLEEKQAYFIRFWKRHDPNPDTEKNELKDEYFRRVNYANEHFSSFGNPGWRSDRGRIYIKFGKPDEVERHPFEMDSKPYVIWRYYGLRKEFLFVDYTGFGDYRLDSRYFNVEYE
jgi:GWxTD domain-containing protein